MKKVKVMYSASIIGMVEVEVPEGISVDEAGDIALKEFYELKKDDVKFAERSTVDGADDIEPYSVIVDNKYVMIV